MYVLFFLLFLLAGSVALGVVRKLRGKSFLPEPAPGEDRHFQDDKSGRWWRESEDGTIEEALRSRPVDPQFIQAVARNTMRHYVLLFLWLIGAGAILAGLGILSTFAPDVGIPSWAPWVGGAVAYFLILRYGRKRGWY